MLKSTNRMNPDLYQKLIRFAGEAHADQKVPGSALPYLVHLTTVCLETISAMQHFPDGDIDLAIACALLHDTIEDTATSYEDIQEAFGTAVADGVLALTKNKDLPKAQQMLDSLEKIRRQPAEVRIVKMADRITNLQEPPHYWDHRKRRAYQLQAQTILARLKGVNNYIEDRLAQKIEAYEAFIHD